MLDPEYLAQLPEPILRLWRQAEQRILADMARRISTYDYWIPAADHQSAMLRIAGRTQDEILSALAPVTRRSEAELRQMMIEAGSRCLAEDAELYRAAGLDVPDPAKHAGLTSTLNTGYQQTAQTMRNLTRSTARTATQQFERVLDRAWLQVNSGAFDYDSAIRGAIKDLAEEGISAIRYPSGRTDSIETAIRRAVLTGVNQTAGKLSMELADEVGCDLVEVSAHAGARPGHALWQGKIYSRSGKSEKYPDFVAATGYGTGAGLCGWNCRHSFGPYVDGAPRVWTDEKLADMNEPKYEYNGEKLTEYEATQQQRYFERQIRRWKREYVAMEAAGQDSTEAAVKLRSCREKLNDFLKQTGLHQDRGKEAQHAFGQLEAMRATRSAEDFYREWAKSIGSIDAIKTLANYYDIKYNDTPRYELLKAYVRSVKTGKMSPMVHFDRYEEYYQRIQNELVGKQTTSGIRITGQTRHFLERVFGTMRDPKTGHPRSGVELEDIFHCVTTSTNISQQILKENGKRSIVIIGENIAVSVNPDTGILVQTNPRKK